MTPGRPALKLLLPLAAGIVIARVWHIPPGPGLMLTGACFLLTLISLLAGRRTRALVDILLPLTVVSFGATLFSINIDRSGPGDLSAYRPGDTLVVEGTIAEFRGSSERSSRFLVECRSVLVDSVVREANGRIFLSLSGAALEGGSVDSLVPGREVILRGAILPAARARNPGDVDWAAYYELAGISGRMNVRRTG